MDWAERFADRSFADLERGTIVLVPSITFPAEELAKISGIVYYEERLLCLALLLADPELRMIYVTSIPIDPTVVDYYLGFLDDPESARTRLELITVVDPSVRSLSEKLLDRADVVDRIRTSIGDDPDAYLLTFNVTPQEKELADRLGIPLFGPSPQLAPLGSKSGSRRLARDAGVPVLAGAEDLYSLAALEDAIARLRAARPDAHSIVIKLNNGFSGQGNVILPVAGLNESMTESESIFCGPGESWASYLPKVENEGAIVEELIVGEGVFSPSVQLRIGPGGECEIVSTHDQILGVPGAQVYLGCRFPARAEYRDLICEYALAVGKALAARGVIGSFGMDFVTRPAARGGFDIFLSEINLRMGGTTHPYAMARLITRGTYDATTGRLVAGGRSKFYIASDNLKSPDYVGLRPAEVIAALDSAGLGFDPITRTGATVHLLGALSELGKLGGLCIGDSREQADALYAELVRVLDELGQKRA